ncbi:hypothetical protein BD779DRAFT_1514472 [Infundibulicybe gibba]|nr:hypothetical protein BD779DRAFT_1514472 [Infundibulicybe gibba]
MLLKFTAVDMFNTTLVDIETGEQAFQITTSLLPPPVISLETTEEDENSSLSSSYSTSSISSSWLSKKCRSPPPPPDAEYRHTNITDASGISIATISWTGRQPDISIGDEKVGALNNLFGSSTVRFMPKILAIPTRFDSNHIWTATPTSLTLFDYSTESIRGTFHQNIIRIPSKTSPTSTFLHTHLPGLGSNYLEFEPHPLAEPVEIIISFLMMEVLRRGRFSLTPYTFQRPKLWQLKEARDLMMRRIRRNTV